MAVMCRVFGQLRADHTNFVRLLDLLETELGSVADEEGHVDYALMQDIMAYMTRYPDHFHHPKEALVFSRMEKRDGTLRPLVQRLAEDHRTLARKGTMFLVILQNVVDGELVRRDAIESSGWEYVDALRTHIYAEEDRVFRLAESLLLEQDWAAIDDAMEHMDDPLFGPVVENDYHRLFKFIMQET